MHVSFALFADAANISQEGKLNILGVFDALQVADLGDVPINTYSLEKSLPIITDFYREVLSHGGVHEIIEEPIHTPSGERCGSPTPRIRALKRVRRIKP